MTALDNLYNIPYERKKIITVYTKRFKDVKVRSLLSAVFRCCLLVCLFIGCFVVVLFFVCFALG